MSKLIESLEQQMKLIYGDSFGQEVTAPTDLSEAIESAFMESRNSRMRQKMIQAKQAQGKRLPPQNYKASGRSSGNQLPPRNYKPAVKAPSPGDRFLNRNRGFKKDSVKSGGSETKSAPKRKFGGNIRGVNHNPFQRSSSLGPGPRKSKHNEAKCWSCKCGDIYTRGCECTGTGAKKTCPEGHKKHITIHKDYHQAYNDEYHAWRAHPSNASKFSGHKK